jgi:4-carboxymuconolactone decarboxylase
MTNVARGVPTLSILDAATRQLVRLSARIASGNEAEVRDALVVAAAAVPAIWVEELILQSYLFSGFPRTLNAMRQWRRIAPAVISAQSGREEGNKIAAADWRARGEATCRRVYGGMYERLRANVRALHPVLDGWMIMEGYGKVLSRPELDLPRRELCIAAACAATGQSRQLLSHLHGALNSGVAPEVVSDAIAALESVLPEDAMTTMRLLWARVQGRKERAP